MKMNEQEVAYRKQLRKLKINANDLAEQIRCNWNALSEKEMIAIVKKIKSISREIDELEEKGH